MTTVLTAGTRLRTSRWVLSVAVVGLVALGSATPAQAALGDLVYSVTFSTPCSFGVGLAFDGTNLWYSCAGSPNLLRADPLTGIVSASYTIPAPGNLGALSYDATRNAIWAGAGSDEVWRIDLDAGKNVVGSALAFNTGDFCGLDDGLAFDARDASDPNDDVWYYSDDCWTTVIDAYDITGALVESFPWAGPVPGPPWHNSGLAVGGQLLYEMSVFENKVYVVDKTTKALQFTFTVGVEHPEDLECDTTTFADQGKHVMWTKGAYAAVAEAFEIEFGTCGEGGQPPEEGEEGRMTGGGRIVTAAGHVTHGFELHCTASDEPNNLQVNWSGNRFHLESLSTVLCTDDPSIGPEPPAAAFDTYTGTGTGRYNGAPGATAEWTFTDAGEPGKNDTFTISIWDSTSALVLTATGTLDRGNHQAHEEYRRGERRVRTDVWAAWSACSRRPFVVRAEPGKKDLRVRPGPGVDFARPAPPGRRPTVAVAAASTSYRTCPVPGVCSVVVGVVVAPRYCVTGGEAA